MSAETLSAADRVAQAQQGISAQSIRSEPTLNSISSSSRATSALSRCWARLARSQFSSPCASLLALAVSAAVGTAPRGKNGAMPCCAWATISAALRVSALMPAPSWRRLFPPVKRYVEATSARIAEPCLAFDGLAMPPVLAGWPRSWRPLMRTCAASRASGSP